MFKSESLIPLAGRDPTLWVGVAAGRWAADCLLLTRAFSLPGALSSGHLEAVGLVQFPCCPPRQAFLLASEHLVTGPVFRSGWGSVSLSTSVRDQVLSWHVWGLVPLSGFQGSV